MKKTCHQIILIATWICLICGNPILRGEDAASISKSPLPNGPLLASRGNSSALEIDYSYADNKTPGSPGTSVPPQAAYPPQTPNSFRVLPARQLILTRINPSYHVVMIQIDGEQFEQWFDGRVQGSLLKTPADPDPKMLSVNGAGLNIPDFRKTDFPDMDWVVRESYIGVQNMRGHPCLVFSRADMTAWIDIETRFAVQWQRGKETRLFKRLPTPTSLSFPANVQLIFAGIQHDINQWKRPPPRSGD